MFLYHNVGQQLLFSLLVLEGPLLALVPGVGQVQQGDGAGRSHQEHHVKPPANC